MRRRRTGVYVVLDVEVVVVRLAVEVAGDRPLIYSDRLTTSTKELRGFNPIPKSISRRLPLDAQAVGAAGAGGAAGKPAAQ